jgi:hypothetical protein
MFAWLIFNKGLPINIWLIQMGLKANCKSSMEGVKESSPSLFENLL